MTRDELATTIAGRLADNRSRLAADFRSSAPAIGHFVLDELLPAAVAMRIYRAFPPRERMVLNRSLREHKYIAAQMNLYDPLLEEALFAFQDPRVLAQIAAITGREDLEPDPRLYAGGISLMAKAQFLNPHVDNSHDRDRQRWRVLNVLYYVSPEWKDEYGGHLELWPAGVEGRPTTLHSRFNRLVVMATHARSWHSVCPIRIDAPRCCVSNYYFSVRPPREGETFHVTSFRGRPEERVTDLLLRADAAARSALRWLFRSGVRKVTHQYRK